MKVLSAESIGLGRYELTVEDNDGSETKIPVIITRELAVERSALYTRLYQCQHLNTELHYRLMSNGRKYVKRQCLACGSAVGDMLKKEEWPDDCKPWNEELGAQYKREEWEIYLKHYYLQRDSDAVEAVEYHRYLLSLEWREKRKLALERDKYLCQGCRKRRATQVHHLTYAHIYDELLFELVSICDECHEKAHRDKHAH